MVAEYEESNKCHDDIELPLRFSYVTQNPNCLPRESFNRIFFQDAKNIIFGKDDDNVQTEKGQKEVFKKSYRSNTPLNEFDSSDKLLCRAFPSVFYLESLMVDQQEVYQMSKETIC